jgi:hypothetical protein
LNTTSAPVTATSCQPKGNRNLYPSPTSSYAVKPLGAVCIYVCVRV